MIGWCVFSVVNHTSKIQSCWGCLSFRTAKG